MTEEKFEALMKSYQYVSSSNRELKNQNNYLRRQLGEAMKQKKKALASSSGSVQGEVSYEGSNPLESSSEEEPQGKPRRKRSSTNSNRVEIPKF